jgi:hypothetical protein
MDFVIPKGLWTDGRSDRRLESHVRVFVVVVAVAVLVVVKSSFYYCSAFVIYSKKLVVVAIDITVNFECIFKV